MPDPQLENVEKLYVDALAGVKNGAEFSGHPKQIAAAVAMFQAWPRISGMLVVGRDVLGSFQSIGVDRPHE